MLKVKIKLGDGALIPKKAHDGDAGYDLYTSEDIKVESGMRSGKRTVLQTGVSIQLPDPCSKWYWKLAAKIFGLDRYYYCAKVKPRSGCSVNGMSGVREKPIHVEGVFDTFMFFNYDCDVIEGLVDQPYRKAMGVIVRNKDGEFYIPKNTRVAQMTIERAYVIDEMEIVDELDTSDRDGGFGKSGMR